MAVRWTKKEDGLLKRLYKTKSASEIAVLLERSLGSVDNRARELGLYKTRSWSKSDDLRLRRLANCNAPFCKIAKILDRTEKAVINRLRQIKLKSVEDVQHERELAEHEERVISEKRFALNLCLCDSDRKCKSCKVFSRIFDREGMCVRCALQLWGKTHAGCGLSESSLERQPDDPTPQEIATRCLEIQKTWTETERRKRKRVNVRGLIW